MDNARIHHAKIVKKELKDKKIVFMEYHISHKSWIGNKICSDH